MDLNAALNNTNVITLAKRTERAAGFAARFYSATLKRASISLGFDGSRLPIPAGWNTTPGAFGACLAHVYAWGRALSDSNYNDDTPFMFFEDDAVFCEGFLNRLAIAATLVPNDYDILYLGGEYLMGHPGPRVIATNAGVSVARVLNVNRLHGYIITARGMFKTFPRLLAYATNAPKAFGTSGDETCFDYELGRMEENGELIAYAVKPFICGQGGYGSDTYPTSDASKVRYWN